MIYTALSFPPWPFSIKGKRTEKPMQLSDYRRIENELQQQIKQTTIATNVPGESLSRKGWSTGYLGLNRNQPCLNFNCYCVIYILLSFTDDSDDEFHAFEPSSPEIIHEFMASKHQRPSTGSS